MTGNNSNGLVLTVFVLTRGRGNDPFTHARSFLRRPPRASCSVVPAKRSASRDREKIRVSMLNDLPCLGSSGLSVFPRLVVSDHCAQDDDELSHDGGDRDLEGLSPAGQPFGKFAEVGMRADRGQSGHVKAGADLAAPPKIRLFPRSFPLSRS